MHLSVERAFSRGLLVFFHMLGRSRFVGCVFLFACGLTIHAQGVWEKTPGPPGVDVTVLYKANNMYFAGTTNHGVYRSTDGGATWKSANNGIARTRVYDIIASGPNLLAATAASQCPSSVNVFKSTDNGLTWTPTSGLGGRVVQTFGKKGTTLYAGFSLTTGSGLARSIDDGNTWQSVDTFIGDGDRIFVNGNAIIVVESNFIWRSIDDGATWDLVEQFALTGIHGFASVGNKIWAVTGGANMEISNDNGATWELAQFPGGPVSGFASDGATIYLGSVGKIFKSTNLGADWTEISTGLGQGAFDALLVDNNTLLAATASDAAGIYRSTNQGATWSAAASGLPVGTDVRSLASFNGQIFAGIGGNGIFRSGNRGNSWTKADPTNTQLGQAIVFEMAVKGNTLFAATDNGIYRSTDGGATFQRTLNGFPTNILVSAYGITVSGNNVVAAVHVSFSVSTGMAGVFYSSDNGDTWHQANIPVTGITAITAVASDGSNLAYLGLFGQSFMVKGLYKSFDGGVNWVGRNNVLGVDIENIAVKSNNVLVSGLFNAYYSVDFGELEWFSSSLPGSVPLGTGIDTYTIRGNSIYAGNEGMYVSTNSGASWTPFKEGFPTCPEPSVQASTVDANYLYGGTFGEGVWRRLLTAAPVVVSAPFDFDGDSKTDVSIFRPSAAEWWINRSADGATTAAQFGATTDKIAPADFTGDGKADIAVWRPSSGEWFVLRSEDGSYAAFPFGTSGDVPVPADYDADGKADAAVFRPSTSTWYIQRSTGGTTISQFGTDGDVPVVADYDGDGKSDVAIYRPLAGEWWINRSTAGVIAFAFGGSSDTPVQGDFTGDGKADAAFWRLSTGDWFILRSDDSSYYSQPFGVSTDIPAPGDYDGDGRFDTTVFRPSTATWYSNRSTAGILIRQFGATGDRPVPNAFVP